MFTNEQQFVLDALRCAIRAEDTALTAWEGKKLDPDTVAKIIRKNGILLTVFPALKDFPIIQNSLREEYYAAIAQSVRQDYEGKRILSALNSEELDCIALKGWEMRLLYPKPTMRQMADLDILVREYNYQKIKKLMIRLGYKAEPESSWMHDSFIKDSITVEIHKRLTDDSGEIQKWEKQLWSRAIPTDESSHIFCMKHEDYYIFHLLHMYKDFHYGCLGLRRVIDTWLISHAYPYMDRAYLNEKFTILKLIPFAERMEILGRVVAGEAAMDNNSECLLMAAFRYGIYGTADLYKLGRIVSMSGISDNMTGGMVRSFIRALFLPYSRMKAHFPVLEKYPVLLPCCWMVRILKEARRHIHDGRQLLDYRGLSRADYEEMKRFFEAGGC